VRVLGEGKYTTVLFVKIVSGWYDGVGGKWRERVPR
jgi:hypothetical protein